MSEPRKGRLLSRMSLASYFSLLIPFAAMRLDLISFREDLLGYHAVGFFFSWWLASTILGAALAAAALVHDRTSRLALLALGCAVPQLIFLARFSF